MRYQCDQCGAILTSDIELRHHVDKHGEEEKNKAKLTPRPEPDIQPPTVNRDPRNLFTR